MGVRCSPCLGPRIRAGIAGVMQLILGLALLGTHVLSELKIITEHQVYGPYYRAVNGRQAPAPTYQAYHFSAAVLALIMVIFTMIFFCGLCKNRSDYICAWIATNWLLVVGYTLMLLYSLSLRIVGFIVENLLVLCVTINFICCVGPVYGAMKSSSK